MLIIDAYNVLNVDGVLPAHLAAPDLVELVRLVRTSRYARTNPVLVCDGHLSRALQANMPVKAAGRATNVRLDGVQLIFSGPGQEADDVIERLLAHHSGSASLLLVSSDRRLQRAARRAGGRYREASAFLGDLAADAALPRTTLGKPEFARRTPLSKGELAIWMQEFGLGPPALDTPPPEPESKPAPPSPPPKLKRSPKAQTPPPPDPDLLRLIQKSGIQIDLTELDMHRWLDDVQPFRPFSPE